MAVRRAASGCRPARGGILRPIAVHVQRDLRRRPARRRAVHRRAGQRFFLVSIAHPRRTDEPLRPRHAAVRRLRLHAEENGTASVSTGRSATRISRPTTTRPKRSSASPARRKEFAARRTASSIRRRRFARTTSWFSAPAPGSASGRSPARQAVTTVPRNGRPAVPLLRTVRSRLQDRARTTHPATCRSFRRCAPAASRSSPTRWRAS